jgi:hypothetical protein
VASIVPLVAINIDVKVPSFSPGTTSSLLVVATKINQLQTAQITIKATDVAGNATTCDPYVADLLVGPGGQPYTETITGVAAADSHLLLENGTPGIRDFTITVNGQPFSLAGVADAQQHGLDLSSAMLAGDGNIVVLTASGPPGASAFVVISDVGRPAANPSAGTSVTAPTPAAPRTSAAPPNARTRAPAGPAQTSAAALAQPQSASAQPQSASAQPVFVPPPSFALPAATRTFLTEVAGLPRPDSTMPFEPSPTVNPLGMTEATDTPPLAMALPRYLTGDPDLLVAEAIADAAGELWQHRTWLNEADGSIWESHEDLGATAQLTQELLVVDDAGVLWRLRLWSDAEVEGTWQSAEDLGQYAQPYDAYPRLALASDTIAGMPSDPEILPVNGCALPEC